MPRLFCQSLSRHPFQRTVARGYLGGTFAVLVLLGMASPSAMAVGDSKRGNDLFQQYCSGCHGPQGRGGRKSGFMPRPNNLTAKAYGRPVGKTMYIVGYGAVHMNFNMSQPFYPVAKSGVIWAVTRN